VREYYYSRKFGLKLQMIFVSERGGRALIATPRRKGTYRGIFRLRSTLSFLFLDQRCMHAFGVVYSIFYYGNDIGTAAEYLCWTLYISE